MRVRALLWCLLALESNMAEILLSTTYCCVWTITRVANFLGLPAKTTLEQPDSVQILVCYYISAVLYTYTISQRVVMYKILPCKWCSYLSTPQPHATRHTSYLVTFLHGTSNNIVSVMALKQCTAMLNSQVSLPCKLGRWWKIKSLNKDYAMSGS